VYGCNGHYYHQFRGSIFVDLACQVFKADITELGSKNLDYIIGIKNVE